MLMDMHDIFMSFFMVVGGYRIMDTKYQKKDQKKVKGAGHD
jgi:hypothetical protein